jgi:hypothetical protein
MEGSVMIVAIAIAIAVAKRIVKEFIVSPGAHLRPKEYYPQLVVPRI